MKNNNLIRFVQSLVVLPVMATSLSLNSLGSVGSIHTTGVPQSAQSVLVQKVNMVEGTVALNEAADPEALAAQAKAEALKAKADAIDAYFADRDMPLEGTGMKMASEAEKNGLDWRLLAAIAVRESTGGKHDCTKVAHNPFGWGSCKIGFTSDDAAIETIARNLGGKNLSTAKHYANKTTIQILHAYNPPSVIPRYAEQVMAIMDAIGKADMTPTLALANS